MTSDWRNAFCVQSIGVAYTLPNELLAVPILSAVSTCMHAYSYSPLLTVCYNWYSVHHMQSQLQSDSSKLVMQAGIPFVHMHGFISACMQSILINHSPLLEAIPLRQLNSYRSDFKITP